MYVCIGAHFSGAVDRPIDIDQRGDTLSWQMSKLFKLLIALLKSFLHVKEYCSVIL